MTAIFSTDRQHEPTQPAALTPENPAPVRKNSSNLFRPLTEPAPFSPLATPEPALANPTEKPVDVPIKQRSNTEQFNSRFAKVDFGGETLNYQNPEWTCARDLETGLLWEVKLFDAGVSDAEHTFSWYTPGRRYEGRRNGGHCFGIRCDTQAYIDEINRLELCGVNNWRLPTFAELETLIDRNYYDPTLNQEIFPHAQGTIYWTSTELTNNPSMVMQIDFFNGISYAVPKNLNYSLRLVSTE